MNCHALFAFIDARKRWDEQQAKKALKAAAAADAAAEREKKRCTATTKAGSQCRCSANRDDGLCATHRKQKAPIQSSA